MSITLEKSCSLVSSFLPNTLIENLKDEYGERGFKEAPMCALALLVINTVLGTIKTLKQNHFKGLDANPGDGGCQLRALELSRLVKMDLKDELRLLEKTALEIKSLLNLRKGSPKEQAKSSSYVFFQAQLGALRISNEVQYLLHCYFSKVLRTPYAVNANGVTMTKSDISKLSILSEKIGALDVFVRRTIVESHQKQLSLLSMDAIRFSASQITSLESVEKELIVTMLSSEHTHLYTPDLKYEPKAFGSLFYEIKTVLIRLREERGIVCLKSIGNSKELFHLLLQSKETGGEFEVIPEELAVAFPPTTPVIVIEAVVSVGKELVSQFIMEQGFTTVILVQSAKEAPYEPGSKLEDVKVPQAVEEINAYRQKGTFLTLDHIYFNSLGAEQCKTKS